MPMNVRPSTARAVTPVAAAVALTLLAMFVLVLRPGAARAAPAAGQAVVSTSQTALGRILVDSRGHTLYLFAKDGSGKSACSGACATSWPPVTTTGKPRAGTGTKASLLGTTKRADGRLQVTYSHHPLYTFVEDTKRGQTSGQNLDGFGAEWYVVSPAGARITKAAATGNTQAAPAAGGWLLQRGIQVLAQRRMKQELAAGNRQKAMGFVAGSTLGRVWLMATAVLLVGIAERESGLAAAVLLLALFTISFAAQGLSHLFDQPEGQGVA